MSVVALPTNVSVLVGSVNVPVLRILEIVGVVNVLLVNVSVVALPTNVSVLVGSVNVPVLRILEIIGVVNVLLVNVSVVALPTNVSVLVGSVNVPVLRILEIVGVVNVLLVSVCVTLSTTIFPAFPPKSGILSVASPVTCTTGVNVIAFVFVNFNFFAPKVAVVASNV